MYYPDEIVEQVRAANDIVDVISSYIPLTKKGGSYFGLCPFHNEKTGSFSVSRQKQMFYCFGCGTGGNVFTFVMQYENYTFDEAMKNLAERAGIKLPEVKDSGDRANRDLREKLLEIHKITANYYYRNLYSDKGKAGLEYLRRRNLSDETIRRFGLGYSLKIPGDLYKLLKEKGCDDALLKESGLCTIEEKGARDKFWNRVMFPIMDINNKVIGFGGRVMGDGEPKYLNSPETRLFDKSRNLYGLNYARKSRKDYLLLCEGYMDVISLHQAGFDMAVASLGTALTDGHASLIKRYVNKVILTYDSDGAGIKAAQRAIPILKNAGISAKILDMKPYKDPDEFIKALGPEEFEKRIRYAENSFLWEIEVMKSEYDLNDPQSKSEYEHRIAKRLCEFSEPIERENYIKACAAKFMIRLDDLRKLVNSLGGKGFGQTDASDISRKTSFASSGQINRSSAVDAGLLKTQRFLISCMSADPGLAVKISGVLMPDEFADELYREVARKVYTCAENGTVISSILDDYRDDSVLQGRVAEIFNSAEEAKMYSEDEAGQAGDKKAAVNAAIVRIKKANLDRRGREATDVNELQEIIRQQAELTSKKSYI